MAFLRRNIRYALQQAKNIAYKTVIRPILEYASTAWGPHKERDQFHRNGTKKSIKICHERLPTHRQSHIDERTTWLGYPPMAQRPDKTFNDVPHCTPACGYLVRAIFHHTTKQDTMFDKSRQLTQATNIVFFKVLSCCGTNFRTVSQSTLESVQNQLASLAF